jgi:hypothetical protein
MRSPHSSTGSGQWEAGQHPCLLDGGLGQDLSVKRMSPVSHPQLGPPSSVLSPHNSPFKI